MPHRLPTIARRASGAAKVAVIGTLAVVALSAGPDAAPAESGSAPADVVRREAATPPGVERLLARHECSPSGFGPDRQPSSAVIRTARGRLRFVDFETGWRVYSRHGAATLVAVCLDQPPR